MLDFACRELDEDQFPANSSSLVYFSETRQLLSPLGVDV